MYLIGAGCFIFGVICGVVVVSLCSTQSELSRMREADEETEKMEENKTTKDDKIRKTEE